MGISDHFNSTTLNGRANVAKATYGTFALLYLYKRFKKQANKPNEEISVKTDPQKTAYHTAKPQHTVQKSQTKSPRPHKVVRNVKKMKPVNQENDPQKSQTSASDQSEPVNNSPDLPSKPKTETILVSPSEGKSTKTEPDTKVKEEIEISKGFSSLLWSQSI